MTSLTTEAAESRTSIGMLQFSCLLALRKNGELSITDVHETLTEHGIETRIQSVQIAIAGLARTEPPLIETKYTPGFRRKRMCTLTDEGRAMILKHGRPIKALMEKSAQ